MPKLGMLRTWDELYAKCGDDPHPSDPIRRLNNLQYCGIRSQIHVS